MTVGGAKRDSKLYESIGVKWLEVPCRVCGEKLGTHTLSALHHCYYLKELIKVSILDMGGISRLDDVEGEAAED